MIPRLLKYLLFENISEPDVGMPQQDANRYFKQLINGVVSIPVIVSA